MENNPMTISSSPDSESESFSQANQTQKQFPLATPPSKKPRGRPLGSKNKPKPKNIHAPKPTNPIKNSIVVKVPKGGNVIDYIVDVVRRNYVSVTILSAIGDVESITVSPTPWVGEPAFKLYGPFTLISLYGSYIHETYTLDRGAIPTSELFFGINFCTGTGELFSGAVCGSVVAATNGIQVELSIFKNPSIYEQIMMEITNTSHMISLAKATRLRTMLLNVKSPGGE